MSMTFTSPFEHRALVEPVEFRSKGSTLSASGVAMRYGTKSKPIQGKFREVFTPGAFAKTIQEQTVDSHNEHGGPYLASTSNRSLRLTDTRTELSYEIDLPDTTAGRDAATLLERGDIRGSSIGFVALPSAVKWSVDDDGMALRSVGEARLGLVDLVIRPAYPASTAELAMRSLADEFHMDVRALADLDVSALSSLISSPQDEDESQRNDEQGRETPTFARERFSWAY